jgi:uncharacterized membrane protein
MSATVSTPSAPTTPADTIGIRTITNDDLRWALREGWQDFRDKRGDLIFVALLYPLIGIIAATVALGGVMQPLFFPLVAGISLFGPAAASGFYELAKRREEANDATWRHFFDPLLGRRGSTIVMLTVGLAGLFALWLVAAFAIYSLTMAPDFPATAGALVARLFGTPEGWAMIIVGNVVGGLFALIVLLTTVVAFPMAIDKDVDAGAAVATSVRAVRANWSVMLGWGARVAAILALASLPAFIGLAVALPVLGYATWHLYTRLIIR